MNSENPFPKGCGAVDVAGGGTPKSALAHVHVPLEVPPRDPLPLHVSATDGEGQAKEPPGSENSCDVSGGDDAGGGGCDPRKAWTSP